MSVFITGESFDQRLRHAVSIAWQVFARKVGSNLIPVNKEASMQLQYAYVLKQIIPLTIHSKDECADLELEMGVKTNTGRSNVDIMLRGISPQGETAIAIELKCYRTLAASGGTRGAEDIFMKDVYEDLHVLEEYVAMGIANSGVALVMNDLKRLIFPQKKEGKCWAYDISEGMRFSGCQIGVPIGGKPVSINLKHAYEFRWAKFGEFWFAELEGKESSLLFDEEELTLR